MTSAPATSENGSLDPKIESKIGQETLPSALYIVATPIGNLGDISKRALLVLEKADLIACEDTRVTRKLLQSFGMGNKLTSYHDHNGAQKRPVLLEALKRGEKVALVSDAGTPLISDPGYKLVAEARTAGFKVIPVPGASALTAILSVAGLPTNSVSFFGFPPSKGGQRQSYFDSLKSRPETLVFYESVKRLQASLDDMIAVFGDRGAVVGRELTKSFEEVVGETLSEIRAHFEDYKEIKGECVVVVQGVDSKEESDKAEVLLERDDFLLKAKDEVGDKAASALAAKIFGGSKRDYYQRLISLSK